MGGTKGFRRPTNLRANPRSRSYRSIALNGAWYEATIYQRDSLRPGQSIVGPVIVEQPDTTIVVPPGWRAAVDTLRQSGHRREEGAMTTSMRTDKVTLEILKSYFVAIAESMGYTLERTSHTTFIKESADFVTAVATPEGEFFAYPRTIGVSSFLGLDMSPAIQAFTDYAPGDVDHHERSLQHRGVGNSPAGHPSLPAGLRRRRRFSVSPGALFTARTSAGLPRRASRR